MVGTDEPLDNGSNKLLSHGVDELLTKAAAAREAARVLASASTPVKNRALELTAQALLEKQAVILEANRVDLEKASAAGLSGPLLKRLSLDEKKLRAMAEGLLSLISLPDPIGEVLSMTKRPNGLLIGKMRVPLGVIGLIYEARPNVTVDAAGICLKSGNALILRGGSEALESNRVLTGIIQDAVAEAGLPSAAVQIITSAGREVARAMMRLNGYIDVLIPRGGAGLIRTVVENATVPVIETGVGNCHVYVHAAADLEKALKIAVNAKTSNPAVCNAAETLLVDASVAGEFLPQVRRALEEAGVELRGCARTLEILPGLRQATEEDWETEYLDLIMAVKVVSGLDEAIAHINRYGTRHSEAIVTEDYTAGRRFLQEVDAAAVYWNASTRFTDGFEYGLGAEIGISTQKLHARGPMGLAELTSIKYVVFGDGQVR